MSDDLHSAEPHVVALPDAEALLARIDQRASALRRRRRTLHGGGVAAGLLAVSLLGATVLGDDGPSRPIDVAAGTAKGPADGAGDGTDAAVEEPTTTLAPEPTTAPLVTATTLPPPEPTTTVAPETTTTRPTTTTTTMKPATDPCPSPTRDVVRTGHGSSLGVAVAPDQTVWFLTSKPALGHRDAGGTITTYPLPPGSSPSGIAVGPDGTVWATLFDRSTVVRLRPGAAVELLVTPTTTSNPMGYQQPTSGPTAITTDADGTAWFVETAADKLGRVTPTGAVTEVDLPGRESVHANPEGLAVAGGQVWVGLTLTNQVAVYDPARQGFVRTIAGAPAEAGPPRVAYLAPGRFDGAVAVWTSDAFAQGATPFTAAGVKPTVGLGDRSPTSIARGPDAWTWVVLGDSGAIARVSPDNKPRTSRIEQAASGGSLGQAGAAGLAADRTGMWLAVPGTDNLVRFGCPAAVADIPR